MSTDTIPRPAHRSVTSTNRLVLDLAIVALAGALLALFGNIAVLIIAANL